MQKRTEEAENPGFRSKTALSVRSRTLPEGPCMQEWMQRQAGDKLVETGCQAAPSILV